MHFGFVSRDVPTRRDRPRPVALELLSIKSEAEGAAELIGSQRCFAVVEAGEEPAAVLGVSVVAWRIFLYITWILQ